MMSKEKRRVPKLRFPGFTEDWEQRKFSDLYEKISEKNDLSYSLDKIISVANMYYKSDAKVSNEEYLKTYNIFRYGEIAFEGNKSKDFAYGRFVENTIGDGIISHVFEVFRPISKYDIYFWKYYINYEPIMGKVLSRCTKKTTMMTNLVAKDFLKETVLVPTLAEQKQIGTLLNALDKSITLHQRKLDNLKLKKKALLQKLFPKNGERYPELRFPGFTDAWEQRKLGDFYTFKNGLNKEKVYFGYGDSIVNFTDVFHNRQIYSSTLKGKVFVNKKELENFKVKEGDLFFTRTSETIDEIGFPAVVMEPMERVVFSGFVLRGRAEKNDPLVNIFKSYIFFTDNFRSEMKKKSSMTTRALTSGTALKEMYFSYPKDLEEQTKIGEILLRLDNVITLHQRKLDHLQLQKKALLQQMFV